MSRLQANGGDMVAAIADAAAQIERQFAPNSLNAILLTPQFLYGIAWHDRDKVPAAKLRQRGYENRPDEIACYFDLSYLATGDAVVVASTGWAQDGWKPLPKPACARRRAHDSDHSGPAADSLRDLSGYWSARCWRILRSHCGRDRRGGRIVTLPLPTWPVRSTRTVTGVCSPHGERTLTSPLRTATLPVSTIMPGLVTMISRPLLMSTSISMAGWSTTASVKSITTLPLAARTSIRRGTVHRPTRLVVPLPASIRPASDDRRIAAISGSSLWGRSAVSAARSP